jgi:RimJ/RimL family protein N-acetyltransferase
MFYLETPRLFLFETPLPILERRLREADFNANVQMPSSVVSVTFPEEWPGDALGLFSLLIKQYQRDPAYMSWGGTIITRDDLIAVGQMSFMGPPDDAGTIELGFGISPAYQRQGYATEMAQAMVTWALQRPDVRAIKAECRADNVGSIRVLENCGLQRVGRRIDEEDGPLLVWKRTAE